ncbi:NAD(P)/FAD-dependent oxidoreductase [Dehalogenimonas alkenigignens]|uniref:NAD(P)/FAD-dependent oxidoreductase n=1 Tax=Dehalogenimonas alkenigignens TaxID=1217799 RepID=UPI001C91BD71|nr:hypothetical protein [Dehalogenimonas alkenigignens]
MTERIAIMGCGSGGSYLLRLLRQRRPQSQVTLFDWPSANACGLKGCAWGLSRPLFEALCGGVGLTADKYFLGKYHHVLVNGRRLKADLAIIDKPAFIRDLTGSVPFHEPETMNPGDFDRVIDATGYKRAFLPAVELCPVVYAVQIRLKAKTPQTPTAVLNPHGGYSWLFPAGSGEVHAGSLSPFGFDAARQALKCITGGIAQDRAVCSCRGEIRCHGPAYPFVQGRIWGIGEAIGLVDPVTAAGIIPAMTSAKLLVENWDSEDDYSKAVLKKYGYMMKEAAALNHLMAGNLLSSSDIFLPKQALETIGLQPNLFELMALAVQGAKDFLDNRAGKDKSPQ